MPNCEKWSPCGILDMPIACGLFADKGYPVLEMEGGFEAWQANELPIEHEPTNRMDCEYWRRRDAWVRLSQKHTPSFLH
jgi:hypothetical protein